MSDYELIGDSYVLVNATDGADAAAAQAAAPEVELFTKGQARIYAKCFRDTGTDTTHAETYAQTSADGAIMEGEDDHPGGNAATDFLNTNTLEADRVLTQETATKLQRERVDARLPRRECIRRHGRHRCQERQPRRWRWHLRGRERLPVQRKHPGLTPRTS
jgi:hypothetical protein